MRRRPMAPWRTACHSASGSTPALTPSVKTSASAVWTRVPGAVVDELGDRAGADRSDVDDLVAHGVQHGPVRVEDRLVAADPDRQPPAPGAAGDRRSRGRRACDTPGRRRTAWRRRTTVGELVLRSKYAWPARMPASSPRSPSATASTSGGPGSEVSTTSAASATWRRRVRPRRARREVRGGRVPAEVVTTSS